MQLLSVVVAVTLFDFSTNLVYATLNLVSISATFDNCGFILGHNDLAGTAKEIQSGGFELETNFFTDDLGACEDCDVLKHCFPAIAKAWGLN